MSYMGEEMLNGLTDDEIQAYIATPETEPHIVVDENRIVTVPDCLKRIAVQYDHNIETVTFDCIRYWDDHDMSTMHVYINYMLSNMIIGSCPADDVKVDENDENIMHFTWTISRNVTQAVGPVTFLVCVKKSDENGNEVNHWNSELNKEMYVNQGLECSEAIVEDYPDVIEYVLTKLTDFSDIAQEVIDARKGRIVAHTFSSLQKSLEADFEACITQGELESALASVSTDFNNSINEINKNLVGQFYINPNGEVGGEIFNDYESNTASGKYSHAHGNGTTAGGYISTAYGTGTKATGTASLATGNCTQATGYASTSIGNGTKASGDQSFATGLQTISSGSHSFSGGSGSTAAGNGSLAFGSNAYAHANFSYAFGHETDANNIHSLVTGHFTSTSRDYQVVFGIANDSNPNALFIIGNGSVVDNGTWTELSRSNALTVDYNGNLWVSGDVTTTDENDNEISLINTYQEIIAARKGRIVANTFSSLQKSLAADFDACITQGELESALASVSTDFNTSINEVEERIAYLDSSVATSTKNLLRILAHNVTQNGIEITVNDDGSVLVNGTASEDALIDIGTAKLVIGETYTLSGCPEGGADGGYSLYGVNIINWKKHGIDTGGGSTFVAESENILYRIEILKGNTVNNLLFYPMVRNSGITDSTYESYIDGTQSQIDILDTTLHASIGMTRKNLLKNTVGTVTQNGITFTLNSDGSVTCSGTATADTNYRYVVELQPNTFYILSGCPADGSMSTYNLFAMDTVTWSNIRRDIGNSTVIDTGTCTTWHVIIRIVSGQTVNDLTFYPMLRESFITDNTYVAYKDDLQTQINALLSRIEALESKVNN